jgi:putative DNA primase/helicase
VADDENIIGLAERQRARGARILRVVAGELPRLVEEAQEALLDGGLPIFQRGGALMFPVGEMVPASDGRMTVTARLAVVTRDLLLRWLAEAATFTRYNVRVKDWVIVDPPPQLAASILAGQDTWPFSRIAGVVTTPTLRPDGSLLIVPGYDAATGLFLVPDPDLVLPELPEQPTRREAEAALELLIDLLDGFEFASAVDRSVALSLILTAAVRGYLPTAPLHLVRATAAGTGKSHLVDLAATIATGRLCPVTTAGKTSEESEKKLGAMLRAAMQIISLDNCAYDLDGDMLCMVAERPVVSIRILGVSEVAEFECRATVCATGNNVGPKGDMNRRTLTCNLVADVERPELREFAFDPLERVLADRCAYLAAAFAVIRATRRPARRGCARRSAATVSGRAGCARRWSGSARPTRSGAWKQRGSKIRS